MCSLCFPCSIKDVKDLSPAFLAIPPLAPIAAFVKGMFAFLKCAFGVVRTSHRAAHPLPIHLWCCFFAYSLSKFLIA